MDDADQEELILSRRGTAMKNRSNEAISSMIEEDRKLSQWDMAAASIGNDKNAAAPSGGGAVRYGNNAKLLLEAVRMIKEFYPGDTGQRPAIVDTTHGEGGFIHPDLHAEGEVLLCDKIKNKTTNNLRYANVEPLDEVLDLLENRMASIVFPNRCSQIHLLRGSALRAGSCRRRSCW